MAGIRSRSEKDGGVGRWDVGCWAGWVRLGLIALWAMGWEPGAGAHVFDDGPDRRSADRKPLGLGREPVPDLRGEPIDRAVQLGLLSGRKVEVGFWPIPRALWRVELDPRRVGVQFPQPGANGRGGSTVADHATIGVWRFVPAESQAASVVVPNLMGRPWDQARAEASRVGLAPFGPLPVSSQAKVVAQYPRPGLTVVEGVSILLIPQGESQSDSELPLSPSAAAPVPSPSPVSESLSAPPA